MSPATRTEPEMGDGQETEREATAAERVEVEYWTDPLCCWSWALEPVLARLCAERGPALAVRPRLGGMIADWSRFADPLNAVDGPAQMGPHWYHVRQQTGVPLDELIWVEDPPASSYPASVAAKAAALQGEAAGRAYLARARRAVMQERRNVARRAVLLELAAEAQAAGELDAERFARDLDGPAALDAFREDVKDARYRGIGRFPTLVLHPPRGPGALLVGWRPYEVLRDALDRVAAARTAP